LLKDSRGHGSPMPCRFSREPGAHRDQLHLRSSFPSWSVSNLLDNGPKDPALDPLTKKHPVLDEWLAKTIHLPGNRNLRDQIQVTVSNQVVHTTQKSVIMPSPKTETEHG
jgi:hypothetical protein